MTESYFADDRLIAHTLPLEGRQREARLVLPRRLSRDEAERIIRMVDAVAFDQPPPQTDTGVGWPT